MKKLKTQKGSVIKRSRHGVGKEIGGCLYFERNELYQVEHLIPKTFLSMCWKMVQLHGGLLNFNVVKWNERDESLTFFESPDFKMTAEPTVGKWVKICRGKGNPTSHEMKTGESKQIWHHKWLFVSDDYLGFDVEESYKRSEQWLKIKDINFSKIGNKDYWYPLLKANKISF
jgi:hypothetical protein